MIKNLLSRIYTTIVPIMILACFFLVSGAPVMAQFDSGRCSDRTISGDYAFATEGVLLPAPGVVLQIRSVGLAHFDGKGNLNWLEHTVINGVSLGPGWTAASGTYVVNGDCTATAVVHTPNSPVPLNLSFVVAKHGAEFRTVLDSNAIITIFTKLD
jgi:hypothetical protein